ncbi:MAG: DUF2834 domain-containing protein [Flammeovirgaceae bacterium]|nr:MAG: DUF2834 domain-containing protein [Flammeovirgaceae bacterium]
MKIIYLILAVIGFIAPNIFVAIESVETGNILLWLDPTATLSGMFGNRIATAFIVDLLVVVFIFFFWTYHEAKLHGIKNVWVIWVLTMLFGMAGTFPLFLYLRESRKF